MAQHTAAQSDQQKPGAVLRPGRAADPAPDTGVLEKASSPRVEPANSEAAGVESTADKQATPQSQPVSPDSEKGAGDSPQESPKEGAEESAEETADELEKSLAESKQRKLRLLLRQCDRVLLLDFNLLAMSDWPDNHQMADARRNRDLWIFSALAAAAIFLSGLTGFVPPWLAGSGFGAFVIILLLGVPFIRRLYTSQPSYLELIMKRQRLMSDARKHAEHLEGKDGLVWQCARMADYNPALRHTRFKQMQRLSEHRVLPSWLTRRDRVRLYLIYLLEAEKAYNSAQHEFFAENQRAIDKGWETVAATPQERT